METQIRAVSWLETFPPDIWAYIVPYLSGEQLSQLKMTGAIYLWRKLTNLGVVKSVKLGADYLPFNSWPAFLNEFPSLEELCIDSTHRDWFSSIAPNLRRMPSTLRKLRIRGIVGNLSKFFVDPNFVGTKLLRLDEHLPHLELLDVRSTFMEDYSWMMYSPQSLTRLHIPTRATSLLVNSPSSVWSRLSRAFNWLQAPTSTRKAHRKRSK